jgi:aminoglycoside phosphotransferase (APT) family kinase protein
VPVPPGVDLDRLTAWLAANVPSAAGPVEVSLIAGGRSNLTYRLTGSVHSGQSMVLRRPPLGHVLATAHDMRREYTVMTALYPTAVPVPRTLALCDDPTVIGAPFYVMEYVDGAIYRAAADLTGADPAIGTALADTLAALHTVDPHAVGLGEFGRPEGFLERQLRRWRKQLEASYTRPLDGMEELIARLEKSLPGQGKPAIVHGDFRLDNVVVRAGRPAEIAAVLDWEMSTLGDPLTDLGITCVYWDGVGGFTDGFPPSPGTLPGWPSRAELVDRYARATGRDVDRLDWYVAFGYFKLAVILEGIWCRYTQGLTVGEGFDRIGAGVPVLVARGLAETDGA